MKQRIPRIALALALAALGFASGAQAQTGGGFDLTWSDISSGGGSTGFAGGIYDLYGAFGQPDTGYSEGGGFEMVGGFLGSPCPGSIFEHGVGCPGTGGVVPKLSVIGCPSATKTLTFSITGALGGSQAFLFLGLGQAAIPMGGGCLLNVAPLLPIIPGPIPMFGSGPGGGGISFPVVTAPGTVGVSFHLQAVVVDPGGSIGFSNTNGIGMTIG